MKLNDIKSIIYSFLYSLYPYLISLFIMIVIVLMIGCSNDSKGNREKIHIYTWSDYFDPEMLMRFEKENNCEIIIDTFDSNEAMYAKLKAGAIGYDIITPSSYLIPLLIEEGIIVKLDKGMLSNVVKNFDHRLDEQILDNEFSYSVPYAVTYGGVMYLKNKVNDIHSWDIFGNVKYSRRMSLMDDIREVIGIGLMYNGYSINSSNEYEVMKAVETVRSWRGNISKFDAESYKNEVVNGSLWLGHGYSSDAAQIILNENRDDIGFSLPSEGFSIAWDEFVITSSSIHYDLAHKFINMFYDDDVSYSNMLYICTLTPNKNAFERLDDGYKNMFYPKNIEKGQLIRCFKDDKINELYNKAWDMIKSTR